MLGVNVVVVFFCGCFMLMGCGFLYYGVWDVEKDSIMVIECMFLIIKFDVIKCNLIGKINVKFEDVGLCIVV